MGSPSVVYNSTTFNVKFLENVDIVFLVLEYLANFSIEMYLGYSHCDILWFVPVSFNYFISI